jgi:hypothetical protein
MLSVFLIYCYADYRYAECHNAKCRYAECHYAECHYAECRYAECHYAECRYAECHYAECRSTFHVAATLICLQQYCSLVHWSLAATYTLV